jgi:hypothetical protein
MGDSNGFKESGQIWTTLLYVYKTSIYHQYREKRQENVKSPRSTKAEVCNLRFLLLGILNKGVYMANLPTPEDTAREILAIFAENNSRPGTVLRTNNFNAVWHTRGLASQDFKPGMEYAVSQGWVEVLPGGASYRLTESGFAEA